MQFYTINDIHATNIVSRNGHVFIFADRIRDICTSKSATEVGTSAASIKRTGKTNARKGVHSNYNEYKEFHEREVEAHICAAFMEMSSMSKLEGKQPFIMTKGSLILIN